MEDNSFKAWAVVELFGHTKLAGYVSEYEWGGSSFVRVEIPATSKREAFTKLLGAKAIYSINPCSEEFARLQAEKLDVQPINTYNPEIMSKQDAQFLKELKDNHPEIWQAASSKALLENNDDLF